MWKIRDKQMPDITQIFCNIEIVYQISFFLTYT